MAKKNATAQVCLRCKLEIFGVELKHLVRLSHGPMHATCHKQHTAAVQAMLDAAIAAGTHSNTLTGGPFHPPSKEQ